MAEKTVTLYTRQNDKTLRQLKRDGRIINHRAYVEMHFGDIAPLPSLGVSTIIFGSLFRFGTATVSINAGFFCFLKT